MTADSSCQAKHATLINGLGGAVGVSAVGRRRPGYREKVPAVFAAAQVHPEHPVPCHVAQLAVLRHRDEVLELGSACPYHELARAMRLEVAVGVLGREPLVVV